MQKHKAIVAALVLAATFNDCLAKDTYVQGYYRNDGRYVQGYHRSSPNSYKWDNYSSYPNRNPYTGQKGYAPSEMYPYGADPNRGKSYYDYRLNR